MRRFTKPRNRGGAPPEAKAVRFGGLNGNRDIAFGGEAIEEGGNLELTCEAEASALGG